ncbi:MAG: helix-turn-helix domain-containing protein [Acidimicrobiales bacterium]
MGDTDHAAARTERLVLTVQEAAEALAVSDNLVYDLTARGEFPCLHLGQRRVTPRQAIHVLRAINGGLQRR